jgi:hypothetical protein
VGTVDVETVTSGKEVHAHRVAASGAVEHLVDALLAKLKGVLKTRLRTLDAAAIDLDRSDLPTISPS